MLSRQNTRRVSAVWILLSVGCLGFWPSGNRAGIADEPTASDAAQATAPEKPAATPEQIEAWIKDLDSDFYITRERATENLAKVGPAALDALCEAADCKNLEVATRAVRAMFQISQANEGKFARVALTRIAALSNRPADKSVAESILNGLREHEAIAEVKELGGVIEREYDVEGETMIFQLRLGEDWRGGDEKLAAVADLKSLRYLQLYSTPVTDEGIPHLAALAHLQRLEVYGTKISAEGVEKLRESLPNVDVQYKRGALLGIRGIQGFQGGAVVELVQEDTAAAAADIRQGDMIVKYDGKPVNSFEELSELIGIRKPGDKATLELVRGQERVTKEVTFGAWK